MKIMKLSDIKITSAFANTVSSEYKMEECGVCIADEHAKDEEWVSKHHIQDLVECIACYGCPLAQNGVIRT